MFGYPFDTTATFYVENPSTTEMTTVYISGFACRLTKPRATATTSPDRAALAAERDLQFDPSITLPEFGEIVIVGHAGRWAPDGKSYTAWVGPNGSIHHKRVIVHRQD